MLYNNTQREMNLYIYIYAHTQIILKCVQMIINVLLLLQHVTFTKFCTLIYSNIQAISKDSEMKCLPHNYPWKKCVAIVEFYKTGKHVPKIVLPLCYLG